MIAERDDRWTARRRYELEPQERALARSDRGGVPLAGRAAELVALRRVGARRASVGRIFEGHVNGAQLVARCGSEQQRSAADAAIAAGHLFGVWNTQDPAEPLRIERIGAGFRLHGAKNWASGAGSITRPIVTAAWPDGGVQMCLLPMERIAASIDATPWRPLGMHESDSFRVVLDGVTLTADELIGGPGDYERQPWFFAGALRFAAVQTGIVERLVDETAGYLRGLGRDGDPFQCRRIAEMTIAARTAIAWLDVGRAAWCAFDADPSERTAAEVLDVVDMARTAVERAALEVIDHSVRCVGAHGLVEPLPFAGLVRDLQMYLRQPAPDAALVRVGRAAFARAAGGAARAERSGAVGSAGVE